MVLLRLCKPICKPEDIMWTIQPFKRKYYKTLSWIETRGDFTDLWLSEFLNYETATFFEEKSFYRPCSNFVATLSLSTRILSQTLKNIICKVFLALLNPFNYFCVVLVTNVHRNRHISFRAFSKIILYWNLDNFDTGVMSKKRPRQWYLYTLMGISYHLAWALLIISVGQSRASIE